MRAPVLRALGLALAVGLLALAVWVSALAEAGGGRAGSAASAAPEGRRAAFLLSSELGFAAELWSGRPGELPREQKLLWLAGRPPHSSGLAPAEELEDDPARRDLALSLHGALYYRRFLDEGGVLAVAADGDALAWLARELRIEALEALAAELEAAAGGAAPAAASEPATELRVRVPDGPSFAVEWSAAQGLRADLVEQAEVLLESEEDGAPLALALGVGRGQLALFAPVDWISNRALGRAEHAALFVHVLERLAPAGRVAFDEYSAGAWRAATPLDLAFGPRLRAFALHALALALALCLRAAGLRGFPRELELRAPVAALQRARAQAALWARTGRYDEAGRALQAGVVARLGEPAPPGAEREAGRAAALAAGIAERTGQDPLAWSAALAPRPVRTARELADLARELSELERAAGARIAAPARLRGAPRSLPWAAG